MILLLSSMVGAAENGGALVRRLESGLAEVRRSAQAFARRPRVYFEEWDEPMISGIRWVGELMEIAGAENVFAELAREQAASKRIIADANEVVLRRPDIIVASWCGKKFRPEKVAARPGFADIPAVRDGELHEVKSVEILQPGPAALTDGVRSLHKIFARWESARR